MKLLLDGVWQGTGFGPEGETFSFEAAVPGCVHTDMLRCGKIPDPYWRDQAQCARWIENWNWSFERTFVVEQVPTAAQLCFEGLDTYCRIYLNGIEIGRAENMFIPHTFPARGLKAGENTLRVVFLSPIAATRGLPERPAAFTAERLYTRRLQCTYSWDWVERFVTMGIYRSAYRFWAEHCVIDDLRCETRVVDDFGALLFCHVEFRHMSDADFCRITLTDPDGNVVFQKRRRIVEDGLSEMIDVPQPQLWWPNGYGDQPLYRLCARVETAEGAVLAERTLNMGIRTVRILQAPDLPGSPEAQKCQALQKGAHVSDKNARWDQNREGDFAGFTLIVNGVKIFCKGANWVPCEPFPSAETPQKIRALLRQLQLAHGNMVRIWGGGLFEQDAFYDACDELGLMVTQDFLMACGHYPEWEDGFLRQLTVEARYAARRLRNHPCLVWWSGDNENAMDADEDMADYHGRRSALRAIGPVLEEMDPNRPFLPSSPYGGRPYGSITRGTTHNTNYMGEKFSYIRFHDMRDYRAYFSEYLSRFCAEEPCMGMPSVCSMRRFLAEDDIFGPDDSMLRFHTKNNPSPEFQEFEVFDYTVAAAEKLLGADKCPEDRVMKLQYIQYEWIRITMELYRRNKWFSSGLIYWMLNDCWPASGCAILDYYARPKAAWYGFRRAAQPVIASIDFTNGQYHLYVCNDGRKPCDGVARLFLQPFDKVEPTRELCAEFHVRANESAPVLSAALPATRKGEILLAEIQGPGFRDRAYFFENRPCDCQFPGVPPAVKQVSSDSITLRASAYVHAVSLDGEMVFEDNFFSLLPGETRTIHFSGAGEEIRMRVLHSAAPDIAIRRSPFAGPERDSTG